MPRCALLTMSDIGDYIAYDHLLIAPLASLGWQAELVAWDVPTDWDGYQAVIIRSPWDYQDRLHAFMAVLGQIEQSSALLAQSTVRGAMEPRQTLPAATAATWLRHCADMLC